MSEKWAWISGWGIQPERFQAAVERALPECHVTPSLHRLLTPGANAVKCSIPEPVIYGGYSLRQSAVDERAHGSRRCAPSKVDLPRTDPGLLQGSRNRRAAHHAAILKSLQAQTGAQARGCPQALLPPRRPRATSQPTHLPYSLDSLTWGLGNAGSAIESHPKTAFGRVHAVIGDRRRADGCQCTLRGTLFPRHTSTTAQGHDYHHLLPLVATAQ